MRWSDEALILSVRPHGETAAIVEVFARGHGRTLGLVHGGQSRTRRPVLQIGNHVDVTWRARLAEQLGQMQLELRTGYAAQMLNDRAGLAVLAAMAALMRYLPERDPHENLFEISMFVLGYLAEPEVWPALYVRWELALLDDLGFGLDLTACAATGTREDLIYVSPKSGKAVSAAAGAPYKDKLLPLPPFLRGKHPGAPSLADVLDGLRLTAFFLTVRLYEGHEQALPEARTRLTRLLERQALRGAG